MMDQLRRSFSALLACLLMLTCLSTPSVRTASPVSGPTQPMQEMPDGLMSAVLAASAQPFEASAEGYRARSGGLDFTLNADGLQAESNGLSLNLTLSGLGRGEQIAAVAEAEIIQADGRLEYRRGALTEWYRDTALGMEQGFTVNESPPGAGLLVLQLDLSTGLTGAPDAEGRGLSFAAPDGQSLRYDHLRACDAGGVELDAHLLYTPSQIMLQVNDKGAAYPITIDPLVYLEQKVIASGAAGDWFGWSVALSGDTALVGVQTDDVGANTAQGSVYVFTRSGTTWTQQAKLTALDGMAYDNFGTSIALSGDTALVGADWADVGANNEQGSAYVFVRNGTTWTQQAKLTASDGAADDHFGRPVVLSGDTALVGAWSYDVSGNNSQGSAYVFTRNGTTWTQQAKLTASDGAAGDYFGVSVALSDDTALVGADGDDVGANSGQGSAYIFIRSGTTWSQQQKLTASDGAADDHFGRSVALSGDTALVGAWAHDVAANTNQGSAYVFSRSGTTWSLQQKLTASDGAADDVFGGSVALSGDTALVGACSDDVGTTNDDRGSAYVFTRSGTTWSELAHLTASDGAAGDEFGVSVALSGDTALVGAFWDDVGANSDQGSAYVFTRSGTTWSQQQKLTGSDGEAYDGFGVSVAISSDTALVGAAGDDVGANTAQGSAYIFTRSGMIWSLQQKLTASDSAEMDHFGASIALSGDTALVGADGDDVGASNAQGSAYVFVRNGTTWTQQAKLTALDGAEGDLFGVSVALSGDTALVGAAGHDVGTNTYQGSAYVLTRSGTTWTQQGKLTASDGAAYDYFGVSVALSGDTALVGACSDQVGANSYQGSAYVFTRSGTTWTQQGKLTASDGAAVDYLGVSVALSGDTALVGAAGHDVGANSDQGSVYVFTRGGTTWTQQQKLTASDGVEEDSFGVSVALSGDTALVGADGDDVGANTAQGSAYVFVRNGTTWTQQAKLTASDGAAHDLFGVSVALSGDTALVGANGDDVGANTYQGSAYFYKPLRFANYLPLILRNAP